MVTLFPENPTNSSSRRIRVGSMESVCKDRVRGCKGCRGPQDLLFEEVCLSLSPNAHSHLEKGPQTLRGSVGSDSPHPPRQCSLLAGPLSPHSVPTWTLLASSKIQVLPPPPQASPSFPDTDSTEALAL